MYWEGERNPPFRPRLLVTEQATSKGYMVSMSVWGEYFVELQIDDHEKLLGTPDVWMNMTVGWPCYHM